MSYDEYLDMFFKAQKMKCPYRAFMFDVVNSKNQKEYIETKKEKYFELINYIYNCLLQEEAVTNTAILLKDENNKKFEICEKPFNLNANKSFKVRVNRIQMSNLNSPMLSTFQPNGIEKKKKKRK